MSRRVAQQNSIQFMRLNMRTDVKMLWRKAVKLSMNASAKMLNKLSVMGVTIPKDLPLQQMSLMNMEHHK